MKANAAQNLDSLATISSGAGIDTTKTQTPAHESPRGSRTGADFGQNKRGNNRDDLSCCSDSVISIFGAHFRSLLADFATNTRARGRP